MSPKYRPILAYSLVLLAQYLFCTTNYFFKRAQKNLSSAQVQYHYFLQVAIYSLFIASHKKYPFHFKSALANKWLIMRSLVGMINTYLFIYSLSLLPVSETTVIGTLGPIVSAALAAFFMGEKFERVIIYNAVLGIIGVIFIAKPSFLFDTQGPAIEATKRLLGVSVSLVTAFLGGSISLIIKKCGSLTHPISMVFYFGIISCVLTPLAMITQGSNASMTSEDVLNLLIIGACGTSALFLFSTGLQYGEAGKLSLLGYTQIVFAFAYEIIIDNKKPDTYSLLGTAFIMAGFLILVYKTFKKQNQVLPYAKTQTSLPAVK